jgi:hypothetical protein
MVATSAITAERDQLAPVMIAVQDCSVSPHALSFHSSYSPLRIACPQL